MVYTCSVAKSDKKATVRVPWTLPYQIMAKELV